MKESEIIKWNKTMTLRLLLPPAMEIRRCSATRSPAFSTARLASAVRRGSMCERSVRVREATAEQIELTKSDWAYSKPMEISNGSTKDSMISIFFGTQTVPLKVLLRYGDGELADIAAIFHKWFTEGKDRGEWLKSLQYGVFGLGNMQYEHFNKIAIDVDDLLVEQGYYRISRYTMMQCNH